MTSSHAQPIEYKVISSDVLAPEDRAKIVAALAEFKSGADARDKANQKGFAVEVLDNRGRVLLLRWQGVDVALLYQRNITTISGPTAKLAKVDTKNFIKSPEDAWVIVNLVTMRYDQEINGLKARVIQAEFIADQSARLRGQLELELEQKGSVIDTLQKKLEKAGRPIVRPTTPTGKPKPKKRPVSRKNAKGKK